MLPGTVDIKNCSFNDNFLRIEVCHFKQDDNRLFLAAKGRKIINIETNALRFSVDEFYPDYPVIRFNGKHNNITKFNISWKGVDK